jgi:hypothetical protein
MIIKKENDKKMTMTNKKNKCLLVLRKYTL